MKTAARKLIGKNASWQHNFYKQDDLDYRHAGANGAAMRNLPIALVNVGDEASIIRNSFLNAIITHGHPRAILGAILFSLAVNYVLMTSDEGYVAKLIHVQFDCGQSCIFHSRVENGEKVSESLAENIANALRE